MECYVIKYQNRHGESVYFHGKRNFVYDLRDAQRYKKEEADLLVKLLRPQRGIMKPRLLTVKQAFLEYFQDMQNIA